MPQEELQLLPVAIWEGSAHDLRTACTFTAMCQLESSMKVRKWFSDVKPNMDCAGTHNDVLCLELYREGLITDSKRPNKSRQWWLWRKFFQQRPDVGTMIAARAFTRLANRFGLDKTVQMWKTGKVGNVNGILYLMQVKTLRAEMMKKCRR